MHSKSFRVCSTAGLLAVFAAAAPLLHASGLPNRLRTDSELTSRATLPQGVSRRLQVSQALGDVSGNAELGLMSLVLAPSAQQAAALDQLLADQQNPSSPRYRKWLTPAQFGASFGVSDQDVQVLRNWLVTQGFSVVSVAPSRNLIQFTGTAAAAQAAFGTHFGRFQRNGQTFFSNTSGPTIPLVFRDVISGVQGLNSYRLQPHLLKHVFTAAELQARQTPALTGTNLSGVTVHELVPYDVRQIYNANSLVSSGYTGTGVTIAVIGQTGVNLTQLAAFQTLTGQAIKPPTLTLVPNSGVSTVYTDDESESEADLEFAGGVAPGASLNFVYTGDGSGSLRNPDVITALEYAITSNAGQIITMSYGECEAAEGVTSVYTVEPFLRQASAQGQTFLNSSGDSGAAACDASTQSVAYDGAQVSYPASSPFTTGVGGTSFLEGSGTYWAATNNSQRGSALGYIPEGAWNESGGTDGTIYAGGGGASVIFSKPSWQTGSFVPADGVRDVPDVSFAAAGHDPYFFCTADPTYTSTVSGTTYTGQCTATTPSALAVAGTSLAAPSFAGLLAIAEQANGGGSLGNINPLLYALSSSERTLFHAVLGGGNQVPCLAGTTGCVNGLVGFPTNLQYSQATGLGSLDIGAFSSALTAAVTTASAKTPTVVATLASQTTAAATFTITVGATNGGATPTGSVTVAVDGGATSTLTLASGTYSYGLATSALSAGTHTLTVSYGGDSSYTAATTSVTFVTGVPAGTFALSLSSPSLTVVSGQSGTSNVILASTNYSGLVLYAISPASGSRAAAGCFMGANGDVTSAGNTVFLDTSIAAGSTVTASFMYQPSTSACSGSALNQTSSNGILTARNDFGPHSNTWPAFAFGGFLLGGVALRRRRALAAGLFAVAMTMATLGAVGCGSGSSPLSTTTTPISTPTSTAGTYNYVITAQSYPGGTVTATTNLTLTVQ